MTASVGRANAGRNEAIMNYKMKSIIYTHKPPESSPGGEIIFAV